MEDSMDSCGENLYKIAESMALRLNIKDRQYHLRTYKQSFLGNEAVAFLISEGHAANQSEALDIGNKLHEMGIINHVTKDHAFKNEPLFYRFSMHEDFHGGHELKRDGSKFSWADALFRPETSKSTLNLQPNMPEWDLSDVTQRLEDVHVSPLDDHNIQLLDNVHPANWIDPDAPSDKYNLVVIGAGAGGLVSSAGAAGVGAKVAIIEEYLMGGDCLNVGCVPSKAIIRCARVAYEARNAEEFGIEVGDVKVNFGKVMERMRRLRASISPNDSCKRFASELGVDVYQGHAIFVNKNTIEVNGQQLKFAAAVIATGASASVPPIPGLADVPFLTNATFFNLTELPERFGVIGTGVIGLELAQAMTRFGSKVTVFGRSGKILEKEDRDAVAIVQKQLVDDGIDFKLLCKFDKVVQKEGVIEIHVTNDGTPETVEVDKLLIATGRTPNVKNMNLEAAGVSYDKTGVKVNDALQTTTKHIFAVGDVCTQYKFTHVADFMARLVIRNALFFGSGKMSSLLIPWTTFTEPEVAHVGLYEADMKAANIKYQTFIRHLSDVDRAICDGQEEGFCKIYTKEGSDRILGATIVAADAGNMISEISVAIQAGFGLGSLAYVIHPYPTQSEAIRQCGDLFNKTRLTPFIRGLFRNLLAWRRS